MSGRGLALAVALALSAAGCSRCGKAPGQDAGAPAADSGLAAAPGGPGPAAFPATDLRAAMLLVFPEFRGARQQRGRAALVRTFAYHGDLFASLRPLLGSWPEVKEEDGRLQARRDVFTLEARSEGGRATLTLSLQMDAKVLNNLFHSPAPLGTESLSLMVPKVPGASGVEERFEFSISYEAVPARARFLTEQLSGLLQGGGWTVTETEAADAGAAVRWLQELQNPATGGRIQVRRADGAVTVGYLQPLTGRGR